MKAPSSSPWPDPFGRWGTGRAINRLPRYFRPPPRDPAADAMLEKVLEAAQQWDRNPNDRCGLLTFAAALMVCPAEVGLHAAGPGYSSLMNRRFQLADLAIAPEEGTSDARTERDEIAAMADTSNSEVTILLHFETLEATLRWAPGMACHEWMANVHEPDLAVHYADHENDRFAVRILRQLLPEWSEDRSRIKLVAMGLDALHRRLDHNYPYWEDLHHWLNGTGFYN